MDYGRAHHRAIHFIHRSAGDDGVEPAGDPGGDQAVLNRVLRTLIEDGLVRSEKGKADARERHLFLTERARAGAGLSDAQRARMRAAYRAAGPAAVQGFRQVLEAMMDPEMRRQYNRLKEGGA
jgi:DNA-binding MarR family transcriptional regulator